MEDGMKQVFKVLARYNEVTNKDMIEILEKLDPAKMIEDLGSYYGSILGLLNHQLLADIGWLRALGTHIPTLDFVPPQLERFPELFENALRHACLPTPGVLEGMRQLPAAKSQQQPVFLPIFRWGPRIPQPLEPTDAE